MAEAKRRGIVPGARIKCAHVGLEGTVAGHSAWIVEEGGLLRVGECDRGCHLFARSVLHDRWATVIAPYEGLTDGMACEPDEHMRKAIAAKAAELGRCAADYGTANPNLLMRGGVVHVTYKRDNHLVREKNWISPGEFYDRLCAMKPKEKPIMIDGEEVEFDEHGHASWNYTFFPAETIARMYEASRTRIDGPTP